MTAALGAPVASIPIPSRLSLWSGARASALDVTERSAHPSASAGLTACVHPSGLRLPAPRTGTSPSSHPLRSSPLPAPWGNCIFASPFVITCVCKVLSQCVRKNSSRVKITLEKSPINHKIRRLPSTLTRRHTWIKQEVKVHST